MEAPDLPAPPRQRHIVVVRHAERADEAPLQQLGAAKWVPSRARHDPPLTRRGEDMASLASSHFFRVTRADADTNSEDQQPSEGPRNPIAATGRMDKRDVSPRVHKTPGRGKRRDDLGSGENQLGRERDVQYEPPNGSSSTASTDGEVASNTCGRSGEYSAGDVPGNSTGSVTSDDGADPPLHTYSFTAVHTSPLLRCLQTAAAIAREFGGLPLVADPALAACAQKVKNAGAAGKTVPFATDDELVGVLDGLKLERRKSAEDGDGVATSSGAAQPFGCELFVSAVEQLARVEDGDNAVLVVTHREGLRELDRLAGEGRMLTPYCCAHEYIFDTITGKWSLVHESAIRVPKAGNWRRSLLHDYNFAYSAEVGAPSSHSRCTIV